MAFRILLALIAAQLMVIPVIETDGQTNLVINPSFEDTLSMTNDPIYPICANWWNPNGHSTDYFSSYCNQLNQGFASCNSLPYDITWGENSALDGESFIGLVNYESTGPTKEYAQGFLSNELIQGESYCVGIWIQWTDTAALKSCDFQIAFTNELIYNPQVSNLELTNSVIFDISDIEANEWTYYQAIFEASGGEQFIYIGSNYPNEEMTCVEEAGSGIFWNTSYVFVDMVTVVQTENCMDGISASQLDNLSAYPNPSLGFITISGLDYTMSTVKVWNSTGRLVQIIMMNASQNQLDLRHLSGGVYFLEIMQGPKSDFMRLAIE
ncbi:MAG: T9SS type A sorting domain-containing protein [Flavobacteriales bacterium]|jgi:hypothetical protein